jgi:hypothetical protein
MSTRSDRNAAVRGDDLRRQIARSLLDVEVGERLPTVRDYATACRASYGAVQAALGRLEDDGAIVVVRRGWLGAYLENRSLLRLWEAAEGAPLIVALPLPSNLRGQGLATGIKTVLTDAGFDAFMTFIRGSRNRLRALREGRCHVVVMSRFAATIECGADEHVAAVLEPQTFAQERRVFFAENRTPADRPLRVVVDRDSADLQRLAELEFADQDVEFVPAIYMQFVGLIEGGLADAAVWDLDETTARLSPRIQSRRLSERVRSEVGDDDTRVALVTRLGDAPATSVVKRFLGDPSIVRIQRAVMSGMLVPGY